MTAYELLIKKSPSDMWRNADTCAEIPHPAIREMGQRTLWRLGTIGFANEDACVAFGSRCGNVPTANGKCPADRLFSGQKFGNQADTAEHYVSLLE